MGWTYTRQLAKNEATKAPQKKATPKKKKESVVPNPIASPSRPTKTKSTPVPTLRRPTTLSESNIIEPKKPNPATLNRQNQTRKSTEPKLIASTSTPVHNASLAKQSTVDPELERAIAAFADIDNIEATDSHTTQTKTSNKTPDTTTVEKTDSIPTKVITKNTESFHTKVAAKRASAKKAEKETRASRKKTTIPQPTSDKTTNEATKPTKSTSTRKQPTTKENKEPSKPNSRKRPIKEHETEKPNKSRRIYQNLPILNDTYRLQVVIKGHTEVNIPVRVDDETDDSKDLWCCGFEPNSDIAAIGGSYTVLFLDTVQGRYIKKYAHAEEQEIFYSMAWSTLTATDLEDESCNILAVAGRLGSIKLLNPLQNECYRYLFGHRKAVLAMTFSKTNPSWLFSVSADNTVRLWDIGSPTSKTDDSACLALFVLPENVGSPCALSISYDNSMLIVGCSNGDMVKYDISNSNISKFNNKVQEYSAKTTTTGDKWGLGGPVATIKQCYVYPHGDEWHEGYIDDICILGQDGDTENELNNHIVSRGADDMEILIWNPAKSKKADASIEKALEWPDSAGSTGLKFKAIESEGQKVLLAGDYDGQIRIYNIGDRKKSKTLDDNSLEQFSATRILSHKMSEELIRDVCCSNDTRTILAVDNNNTVFIWTTAPIAN